MDTWQLQEAKNKLSQVVNLAEQGRPQHISKHGRPAVVVMSAADYHAKMKPEPEQNFVEFLMSFQLPETLYADGQDPFPRIKGGKMREIDWED